MTDAGLFDGHSVQVYLVRQEVEVRDCGFGLVMMVGDVDVDVDVEVDVDFEVDVDVDALLVC